jgi:peptidoglycan DL-endopeptidase CwlO
VSIGRTNRTRGIALAAITGTGLLGVTLIQGSAVADPKPTLPQARAQVASLQHKAEVAGEAANDLRDDIKSASDRVKALQAAITKQQVKVDAVKRQIGSLAVAGYQTSGMTTTAQLLLSADPDQFLTQASTAQAFAGQQNSVLRRFQAAQGRLTDLQASQQAELAALQAVQAKQDGLKNQLQEHLSAAQKVLGRLSDAERRRLRAEEAEAARKARASRSDGSGQRMDDLSDVPVSGRASAAVAYAMAQLGDPYVWGADGPSSFDCSGLTMAAWARAGVSLSHSSRAQYSEGRRVSKSDLEPGDLVFYYQPISHVGMYIGNGRIVHASHPGAPVQTASVNLMPYTGAVRPG